MCVSHGWESEWKERKSWKGSEGWLSGTVVSLRGRSLGSQTVPSPLSGPRRAAVQIRSYRGQSISAAWVLRGRTVPRLEAPSGLGGSSGAQKCPAQLSLKLTTGCDNGPRSLQPQSPGSEEGSGPCFVLLDLNSAQKCSVGRTASRGKAFLRYFGPAGLSMYCLLKQRIA